MICDKCLWKGNCFISEHPDQEDECDYFSSRDKHTCSGCGDTMVPSGTCWKCPNCGETSGCS